MRDAKPAQFDRLSHGHPDDELIHALEPDQIVAAASCSLPRYRLSRAGFIALWMLRVFVLLITALVVYTFIIALP
jgi:hypothetical protein